MGNRHTAARPADDEEPTSVCSLCTEPASNGYAVLRNGVRICGVPEGAPHPFRHIPRYAQVRVRASACGARVN